MTEKTDTYAWNIVDIGDNGEFISWATVEYIVNGEVTETERFIGSGEEPPGYTGLELARSAAHSWHEAMTYTLEERLGPYGIEWKREQNERQYGDLPF